MVLLAELHILSQTDPQQVYNLETPASHAKMHRYSGPLAMYLSIMLGSPVRQ